MSGWKCFLIERSPYCRRTLRRYASGPCPKKTIHDVSVIIDHQLETPDDISLIKGSFEGDPRWPAQCFCGYSFREEDHWQVHSDRLYMGFPDGKLYALRDSDLPIGAMWNADWLNDSGKGPDGLSLVVHLPGGGDFSMDTVLSGHSWSRTGIAPNITVHPSINHVGVYHGYLRDGILTEDSEGRTFPGVPRTA